MKKLLMIATLLALMLAMFNIAFADTVTVGTGTATSSYLPIYGNYGYSYSQQIYTQAQINKAGNITKIRFYYVSGTITNSKDWVIYMGHSAKTTFATTTDWEPLANLTEVFNGDVSSMVPLANNWMEITLTTPFNYNNSDNLIVAVDENTSGYASMSWGAFTSGANTGIYYYSDSVNPNPATPPAASSRVALINRMQFVFPNTAAPLAPTLLAPANGGWSFTDGKLIWSNTAGGADAATYNVYFGSSATPPLVSNAQTGTSYTPTLAANTTYYWKVVATNEIGSSPASPTWSFKTPSATQVAESFENVTPFPPAGWANPGTWSRSTSYAKNGAASAYKYGSSSTAYILSTPKVTITSTSTLDLWTLASATTGTLQIVYSPDRVTWTQLGGDITHAATYTWYNTVADLSTLAGNNYYLGVRTGLQSTGFYIDAAIGPEITPEAPGPVTLTAPADLATGLSVSPTFTWTVPTIGGVPTGYKVYCDAANPPTTLLGTATTLSYTPTAALPYNTTLYWMVVATNGAGDATGNPVRSFTTMTDPTITSFPFVEGFETGNTDASTAINQWMQITGPEYTAKYWTANSSQTTYNRTPRTGTWNAFLQWSGQSSLVRPIQLTANTNYFIELYARQDTAVPANATIQVKYGTGGSLAGLTQTIIPETGIISGDYQRFYGVFTPSTTGLYYIGIQGWLNSSPWYISLDDITIGIAPDVLPPSALTSTNIDGDSADLGWTEHNVPAATAWKIKYGPVGFDVLTQGTLINSVTANPYPLTGLSSSTSYDWYVLAVTGAGSSTWAGPGTFRTAQIPATLPLTEGWESGQGSWAFENGTETNTWHVGTVAPFAGTASAYVSNDSGVTNAYTITTTSVAHIYRDISFGADNLNFPLSFQWRNAGESTWDRMRVYLVDTSVTPVAGTELTTGQVGLTNYSVQPTWTTGSITLPGTLSGSVKRLVFSWKNDGSGGTQPPINLDNISLTAVPVPSGPVLAPNLDYPANRQLNLAKTGFPFQFSWNMAGTEPDVYNLYIANVADLNEGYDSDEFFGAATFFEDVTSPYTPVMSYAYGATYVWTVAGFNAAYPDEVYLWPPNEFTIEPDPAIVSFPHTQNFDAVTVPALPTGWSMINVNGDTVNWASYATNPYSAPNCASIGYNYDLALNDWMVSPALSLQAGTTYALDFKYRGGSTSYVEKLKVMLGSGNQVANLTTQVFINENINFADYTSANATFTVPSTGNYYLGWHAYSIANQLRIYVDDITIRIPAPLPPLAATVSFPQSGSTTLLNPMLKWTPSTAGEPATSFKVYLNQGGAFTESHVVYTGAATQFQTTGLVNGLSYSWKVVPSNANGSTVTCPTWTFNTPGLTQLAEGFEAATFPPMGWANGSSGSWSRSTSTPLFEGTASAYKLTSTSLVYDLSTPLLTIVAGSKIDFYTRASATSQVMQVVYSTDRLTWTQIGTDITYAATGIWYPISINLSSLAGTDYYIGFRTPTHTSTGSIYVDHVIGPNIVPVRPDPVTQSAPANAAVNQVRRPTLTWTSPSTGGVPTGYKILCDASATPITPTTQVALATGSPYTFEADLNWGTTYYWSVVPTNSVGDASPNTVRSFTVMDDPTIYVTPSTPYLQAFGTVPPAGWSRYTGLYGTELTTTTSGWTTDDFVNLTTPVNPSARLNVYGTTTKYWLVTAPISIPATGYELKMDIGLTTYSGIQIAPTPGAQADDKFIVAISDSPTMTNPTILREWNNSGSAYVYDTISPTGENQSIDLSPYAGTKYIAFYGESTVSGGDNNIYVDNVKIWLPVANDLAATLVAGPGIGVAGTQLTYNVTVVNNGTAPQSSYNVYLKKFGAERLATLAVNTPLAAGATAVHTITWTPATAGTYSIVGESGLTGDMAAGNNESAAISTSVYPIGTYMPMVGNIASTTSTYMYPINVYYKNSLNETIYLGHELQASSGTINAIILQNNFTQNVTKPIKLWMKHTTESNLTAAHLPFTGYQLVFDGDVYFPMGVNAVVINLTTPFVYTGGNLAVRTYAEWESTYSNNTNVFYYTASPEYPNRTRYVYVDGDGAYDPITLTPYPGSYPTTGTVSNIPNTAFVMSPATPITTLAAPVATVVKTGTNAVLNWAAIPGAFAYRVYASDDPYTFSDTILATVYTNSYTAAMGTNPKKFYKVVAISYHHTDRSLVLDPAAAIGFDNSAVKLMPYIPETKNKD